MVQVDIFSPRFSSSDVTWQTVATLRVDGDSWDLRDPGGILDRALPVLNADTGQTMQWQDGPEDWARYLPSTLRGPELLAVVVADSHPRAQADGHGVARAHVEVPVTARQLAPRAYA